MALFRPVVRTTETLDLVYSYDPCVTAPEGEVGWLPVESCVLTQVDGHAADVITVRGLDVLEVVAAEDSGGTRAKALAFSRRGVVKVNGSKKRKDIDAWLDGVAMFDASTTLVLLGMVVSAITRATDPRAVQRFALGKEDDDKSGDHPQEGD